MIRKLADKFLVPVLTILIIVGCIWGLLHLTQKVGENLAPIKPRVLVFGATYCGYCPKYVEVQKLADDFPDVTVEHYQIDVDPEGKKLAKKYHISRTPTIIVCDNKGCQVFYALSDVRAWLGTHSLLVNGGENESYSRPAPGQNERLPPQDQHINW